MDGTEADEANGVILKAVIELSVALAGKLCSLPETANDEKGKNGKAEDAADNGNDNRLWCDCSGCEEREAIIAFVSKANLSLSRLTRRIDSYGWSFTVCT